MVLNVPECITATSRSTVLNDVQQLGQPPAHVVGKEGEIRRAELGQQFYGRLDAAPTCEGASPPTLNFATHLHANMLSLARWNIGLEA